LNPAVDVDSKLRLRVKLVLWRSQQARITVKLSVSPFGTRRMGSVTSFKQTGAICMRNDNEDEKKMQEMHIYHNE